MSYKHSKNLDKFNSNYLSGNTIYSAGTDLYDIFLTDSSNSQSGSSVHVSTFPEWVEAMRDDEITAIYVDKTFTISGTIDLDTSVTEKHIFGDNVILGDGSTVTIDNRVTTYFHNHIIFPDTSFSVLSNDSSTVEWYFTRCKPTTLEGPSFTVTWGSNWTVYYETIFQERGGAGSQFTFAGGDITVDTINNTYGTFRKIWDNSAYVQNLTYVDNLKQFIDALNDRSVGHIHTNKIITISSDITTQCKSDKQIFGEAIYMANGATWSIPFGNEIYINNDLVIQNGTTATINKASGLWLRSIYGAFTTTANYDFRGTGKLKVNGAGVIYERLLLGATFDLTGSANIGKQYWIDSTTESTYFVSNEQDFLNALQNQYNRQIVIDRPLVFTSDTTATIVTKSFGLDYSKLIRGESITLRGSGGTGSNGINFTIGQGTSPAPIGNIYTKFYNDIIVENGDVEINSTNGVDVKFRNVFNNTNEVYLTVNSGTQTGSFEYEKADDESLVLDGVGGSVVPVSYWDNTNGNTGGASTTFVNYSNSNYDIINSDGYADMYASAITTSLIAVDKDFTASAVTVHVDETRPASRTTIAIYDDSGDLLGNSTIVSGFNMSIGFNTIELESEIVLQGGTKYYIAFIEQDGFDFISLAKADTIQVYEFSASGVMERASPSTPSSISPVLTAASANTFSFYTEIVGYSNV